MGYDFQLSWQQLNIEIKETTLSIINAKNENFCNAQGSDEARWGRGPTAVSSKTPGVAKKTCEVDL